MSFTSLLFIAFISIVILLYYIVSPRMRWVVLLVASYCFMFINSRLLVLIHFATVLTTFLTAAAIDNTIQKNKEEIKSSEGLSKDEIKKLKLAGKKKTRRIMWIGILIDLGTLLFLKYYNFFISGPNVLLGKMNVQIPTLSLLLPIARRYPWLSSCGYRYRH